MTDIAHVTVAAQGDMPKALNELIKFATVELIWTGCARKPPSK